MICFPNRVALRLNAVALVKVMSLKKQVCTHTTQVASLDLRRRKLLDSLES